METTIQIFTSDIFGEIRTCQINNEIMFVGKDVATALGYSNTRDALRKHVDDEDKGTVAFRDTAFETRAVVINESGLYSLILSSKLPQAIKPKEAFRYSVESSGTTNAVPQPVWKAASVLPVLWNKKGATPAMDAAPCCFNQETTSAETPSVSYRSIF